MENTHAHSSIKILNDMGESSERTNAIITLADFVKDNNEIVGEMLETTKEIIDKLDENKVKDIIKDNNDLLILKIKDVTKDTKTDIVQSIKEEIGLIRDNINSKIDEVNKYLLLKITVMMIIIATLIDFITKLIEGLS